MLLPVLAFVASGTKGKSGSLDDSDSKARPDLAHVKKHIVALSNRFRQQDGRGQIKEDPKLSKAAQAFAEFMARTDEFNHTADGKEPAERVADAGYRYCIVAENIANESRESGFTTDELATRIVEGWKKSPPHRKNLLDADVLDIGVGLAQSSKSGKYYAVQDFGRPKSKEIKIQITNRTDATVSYTLEGKSFSIEPRYTLTHRLCRPSELKFEWPSAGGPAAKFQPKNGSYYAISKDDAGKYRVDESVKAPKDSGKK
jgi:uncharacterized protein YkwD